MQQREGCRHEVMTKALKEYHAMEARSLFFKTLTNWLVLGCWLYQVHPLACLLQFLPKPWQHTFALDSSGWVVKTVGWKGITIDMYGDAVMNCDDLTGDTWRHDTVKTAIVSECLDAKLPHDCEVYGLFADLLSAIAEDDGGGLEWGRARQGLIPAFRPETANPRGDHRLLSRTKDNQCWSDVLP